MARRPTQEKLIEELTAEWEPRVRKEFLDAVDLVASDVVLAEVVERLRENDVEGAVRALGIERSVFNPLAAAVVQAVGAGGIAIVGNIPAQRAPDGGRVVLRFDVRDPVVEDWAERHSSTLVQGLTEEARESARLTIRQGLEAGRGPHAIATDLAGRINTKTKRREGGTIGLTRQQVEQRGRALEQLQSGDPKQLRDFKKRALRDARSDSVLDRAIRGERPLTAKQIDSMINRLTNRMIQYRSRVIARTETGEAMETAQHEGYRQTMGRLQLDPTTDVEKEWVATSGDRTRDTHRLLHGQVVTGLDTPFHSPSGALMRYPMDRSFGAPASETIQCRCHPRYRLKFERARA